MAIVEVLTKARMLAIEAASIVGGVINSSGHLILTKHDGSTIDAGSALPALPTASDTVSGIATLATNAEVITGTNTTKIVTPAALTSSITTAKLADSAVTNAKLNSEVLENTTIGIPGEIRTWAGITIPSGWLLCDGASVSRTTYARLYNILAPTLGAATISIASPGVVTYTNHGLIAGDKIYFTTTGALPTGLSANTLYYVLSAGLTANTFRLSSTLEGTAINTSGSQSGTHTIRRAPYGIANASTFMLPNLKGRIPVGRDASISYFDTIGKSGGENTHTLTEAEIPAHSHSMTFVSGTGIYSYIPLGATGTWYNGSTGSAGGGNAHNNLQPYLTVQHMIKY